MRLLGCFIISVLLASCSYEPYARPRIEWQKQLNQGKPKTTIKAEAGILIKWKK